MNTNSMSSAGTTAVVSARPPPPQVWARGVLLLIGGLVVAVLVERSVRRSCTSCRW